MSQHLESQALAAENKTEGWTTASTSPNTLWEFVLHTRSLVWVALGASLWWMLATILPQWAAGDIPIRAYPWAAWVDHFWLTALFVLLLARLFEKSYQIIGPPPTNLPSYTNSQQYSLALQTENKEQWEQFCTQAQSLFGSAEERTPQMYWTEQGMISVWGSLFVILGGLVILIGSLAAPYWPTLHLGTRLPLLGLPWVAIGLLLQWGKPQSVVVWWKNKTHIHVWAYSEFAWSQIQPKLQQLQTNTATNSTQSYPTTKDETNETTSSEEKQSTTTSSEEEQSTTTSSEEEEQSTTTTTSSEEEQSNPTTSSEEEEQSTTTTTSEPDEMPS